VKRSSKCTLLFLVFNILCCALFVFQQSRWVCVNLIWISFYIVALFLFNLIIFNNNNLIIFIFINALTCTAAVILKCPDRGTNKGLSYLLLSYFKNMFPAEAEFRLFCSSRASVSPLSFPGFRLKLCCSASWRRPRPHPHQLSARAHSTTTRPRDTGSGLQSKSCANTTTRTRMFTSEYIMWNYYYSTC